MKRPWAPTATLWLLAFDLSEPRIRRRLDRLLKGFGFLSSQYSLLLSYLTPGEVRRLRQALRGFPSEGFHLVLLPLGTTPPQALVWGRPLGMGQVPWGGLSPTPPSLHVGGP